MRTSSQAATWLTVALAALGPGCPAPAPREPAPRVPGLAVSFVADDSAGQAYREGELALVRFPGATVQPLYDDGPWTEGGHEAEGAVAGDHRWGLTVFARPEPSAQLEYGFLDRSVDPPAALGPARQVLVVWKGQAPAVAPALVLPPKRAAPPAGR